MLALSIVIPVYNEESNISKLLASLEPVLEKLNLAYEILFVDDGSDDRTAEIIREEGMRNQHIRALVLSRNFGHQVALSAGLENAAGDIVITLDGDLQHPAELIPTLIEKHREGFDVVNTFRTDTDDLTAFKRQSSKWFYRLFNSLADVQIEPSSSDFRLYSRRFLKEFLKLEEKDRFIRGMIKWVGFPQTTVPYKAAGRNAGSTKYNKRKMLSLSSSGLTSFSSSLLRVPVLLGVVFCVVALFYSAYILYGWINHINVPGWTSIIFVILFVGGIQLICLGIISEYILRIFNEAKRRPLYIVKDKFDGGAAGRIGYSKSR
jgi:polyisoprenyl-phosphate glycosyltransferase